MIGIQNTGVDVEGETLPLMSPDLLSNYNFNGPCLVGCEPLSFRR